MVTAKRPGAGEIPSMLMTGQSYRGRSAWILALIAVAGCFALRNALEVFGQFYYLPMVPGVLVTAMLTRRGPTALAIGLSVLVNALLVPREGMVDAIVNAGLFIVEGWLLAEICWAQRRMHKRSIDLARDLAGRSAILDTVLATVPVVILDRRGAVRRLTPAAADLFGIGANEADGRPFSSLVHGFGQAHLEDGGAARPLEAPTGLWIGRRPDGAPLLLGLHVGVLPEAESETGDYAAVCLTDRTEAETATERARDLDEQLNRVWRLNSLGEMAATLAHELNQPLSAAATYVHSSQRDIERIGPLGQSAGHTLELAKGQMIRAGNIIRRMRDLLNTGARRLEAERISSMIDDLGQAFALIAKERGVEIRTNVDPRDDLVRAERIQFQQAMINLVRNAVDAVADRPDAVVVVNGRPTGHAGYHVSVEDNGPGIPDERIEDIFRPLTTTKASGMGLGLSVTRTIVEGHGGVLAVGRSPMGGAAFTLELPREAEAA